MTDLSKFAARDRITVDLDNPSKNKPEPLLKDDGDPMTYEVYTSDSAHYREQIRLISDEEDMTRSDRADALIKACLAGVDMQLEGEAPDLDKVRALSMQPSYAWLKQQFDRAIHDRTRFFAQPSDS